MAEARVTIAVVDYGMGNLRSVHKALEQVGAVPVAGTGPDPIGAAAGVLLPGVGAFAEAMRRIRVRGLEAPILAAAERRTPLLGICLGMQLLFESSSEHGGARGLGLLAGPVERLAAGAEKLPHIGWSPLRIERRSALTEGIAAGEPFYFVHSFAPRPRPADMIATAEHGERFAAVVGDGAIAGTQFHPEKSSSAGLRMLANFVAQAAPVGAGT